MINHVSLQFSTFLIQFDCAQAPGKAYKPTNELIIFFVHGARMELTAFWLTNMRQQI